MSKLRMILAACVLAAVAGCASADRATSVPPAIRVGTYDSRAIALAYARSEEAQRPIERARLEAEAATKAGDAEARAAVETRMKDLQALRHLQVFGNAPIPDILVALRDSVAAEARAADVVLVVRDIDIAVRAKAVETVDLTPAIIRRLAPTEETLRLVDGLKGHPPLPLEKFPVED